MPFIDNSSLPFSNDYVKENLGLTTSPQISILLIDNLKNRLETGKLEPGFFLADSEQEQFRRYQYEKRSLEWLGGRLAAKKAILEQTGQKPTWKNMLKWPVATDKNGRPFFGSQDADHLRLSISHSGVLAGAMVVSGRECGLDLQQISSATVRVKEKFCSPAEDDIISHLRSAGKPDAGLTLLWSAKEALRKARGGHPLTGFQDMTLVEVEELPGTLYIFTLKVDDTPYRAFVCFYNDFAIAMTTTPILPST